MPYKCSIAYSLVGLASLVVLPNAAIRVFARESTVAQPQTALSIPDTSNAAPRFHFASTVFDFGKVLGGAVVMHDFDFTNTGTELLVIKDVHSGCGCTSATKKTTRQVEPGKHGTISVEFHTSNFSGPVTKAVTVTFNDTNLPLATLELKGNIWRPIELAPPSAAFSGLLDSPTNNYRIVRIINKQDQALLLSPPQTSRPTIAAELKTNQLGKEYELVVKLVPPLGSGNIFGEIKLKTSAPEMPVLTVPVWAVPQVRR